jgi:hypothetical protein
MNEKRKEVALYDVSVTNKSLLHLVNDSDDLSFPAMFLFIYLLFLRAKNVT